MIVSLIVPIYNEETHIESCLSSILAQDYAGEVEILLIDGGSTDKTRLIISNYVKQYSNIRLLDNPKRITPHAMNVGIENSHGELIIIMGAHADYAYDYVSQCVEWSKKTGAENVGGPALARGDGYWGKAIEYAHYSLFGLGGADFRTGVHEGYTDTVFGGAFRREVFDKVGLYDERLVRNQDIELNARIIASGGKCFITPDIKCTYYCRSNLKDLWEQNYNNGLWNIFTTHLVRSALSLRHFTPLLFVSSLILSFLLILIGYTVFKNQLAYYVVPFVLCAGSYVAATFFFSIKIALQKNVKYFPALLIVFPTLHISYGWGSLIGLFSISKGINNNIMDS